MSISPADPLQPIPPSQPSPSAGERLVNLLYNPTYLAILASVGIHGLAVAAIPVVAPMVTGAQKPPTGPRETNIVQLTRSEAARVNSAFPSANTTSVPPGLPYFNPNAPTGTAVTPPPLSGDLLASKSGRSGVPFSWQPYPPEDGVADSSGEAGSTSDVGVADGGSTGAVEQDGTVSDGVGNAVGNTDGNTVGNDVGNTVGESSDMPSNYPGNSNTVDLREWYRNYGNSNNSNNSNNPRTPSGNKKPAPNTPVDKKKIALNDRPSNTPPTPPQTPNPQQTGNTPSSPEERLAALENSATYAGTIPGERTGQAAVQALEGNYPVLIVRNADGTVEYAYLGDDPLAEAAIEYTLTKNPSVVPLEPGSYRYDVAYGAPASETPSDLAGVDPTAGGEIPADDPQLQALQEEYPQSETIASGPISILSEVAGTTQVAITIDAQGNPQATLLKSSGDPELDRRAIEEAQSQWDAASASAIQTFEIEFVPDTSQPLPEKPPLPQEPTSDTPAPKPVPEASEESTIEPTPKPVPEASEESTIEPAPKPVPEASEDSNVLLEEKVPLNVPVEEPLEETPIEIPQKEPLEETPIETSPVLPKKPRLDSQSLLPSLEN